MRFWNREWFALVTALAVAGVWMAGWRLSMDESELAASRAAAAQACIKCQAEVRHGG